MSVYSRKGQSQKFSDLGFKFYFVTLSPVFIKIATWKRNSYILDLPYEFTFVFIIFLVCVAVAIASTQCRLWFLLSQWHLEAIHWQTQSKNIFSFYFVPIFSKEFDWFCPFSLSAVNRKTISKADLVFVLNSFEKRSEGNVPFFISCIAKSKR